MVEHRVASRTRRMRVAAVLLVVLVVASIAVSLCLGSRAISLTDVLGALFGGLDSDDATVVTSQRLPRTLLGLVVGLALGMAGALMQGHTRNPLADPGLFGVNAGAGFAVAGLVFVTGTWTPASVVVAALVGAGAVSTLVLVVGLGRLHGGTLVLIAIVGTTVTLLFSSLTSALQILDRDTLDVLRFWDVGSIASRDTSTSRIVLPILAVGAALALVNSFALSALGLGEDVAQSLGHDVRRARIVGITAITLLAGASTAVCGPIAFLGLVAPHAARLVTGHDYRWLVPFSGLAGAAILLVSDTLGRVAAFQGELQVGIVMSAVGAPVLLAITRRRRLVSL